MPTAYPFPNVARIALSFLVSVKQVDSVPRIVEIQPWERAEIVSAPSHLSRTDDARDSFLFAGGI